MYFYTFKSIKAFLLKFRAWFSFIRNSYFTTFIRIKVVKYFIAYLLRPRSKIRDHSKRNFHKI